MTTPLERTLEAFATQAATPIGLAQMATIAAGLAIGWFVSSALRRRVTARGLWKFGAGGFDRVAFPLVSLVLLWAGRFALGRIAATHFVDLAISLLVAFAVIRMAVYVLRHVLPEGAILRGTERTVAIAMWAGWALHVTGVLPELWEALEAISFTVGRQKFSLMLILQGLLSVAVTLAVALWLASLIEGRILAAERVELSTRVVAAKLVRAVSALLAVLIALPIVGIDITALSVFGGALGVGLAVGLQKIASNYVSGFIILLDRSVRLNDLVTVDGRHGVVKAIASRYTVIRGLDGTESIVPNETLITQAVTNHSYSDRKVLLKVPVTVSYDADVDRVFGILAEAARRQPRVLAEPPPGAWIAALGENGVEIELGVWIDDPDQGQSSLRGAILKDTLAAFRAGGIEIPYPTRDVRVVQGPPIS